MSLTSLESRSSTSIRSRFRKVSSACNANITVVDEFDLEYRILGKKGEGTFSEVLKCQHVKDGTYYACKKMKQHYDGVDQVNNLREIQAMRRLNPHANIIGLHEIIYDKKTGTVALICELMDMNIYEMIRGRRHYIQEPKVKSYMFQLLKSIDHMHRCGIFHRDVKPENILVKDDVLKLADFGSCRSVYSKPPYTEYISTRWYRAPECLLTDGYYSYRMDLWSVGCVFFEVMSLHPLFPGSNEVDQISKIHDVLGTPDASVLNKMKHRNRGINFDFPTKKGTGIEKLIPHASQHCIELIYKMCTYDPDERITAKQALRHPYFRDMREADKKAQEAQQLSRFNEASSIAGAGNATSTTGGDVPLWRQNQAQKKRDAANGENQSWDYRPRVPHPRRQSLSASKKSDPPASKKQQAPPPQDTSLGRNQRRSSCSTCPRLGNMQCGRTAGSWNLTDHRGNRRVRGLSLSDQPAPDHRPRVKRRQRRLVEQHHNQQQQGMSVTGHDAKSGAALPQLVPVNGATMTGGAATFGAAKSIYASSLPKVHLPHHHHHHQGASNLLPGILKTNMLQPKTLHKAKIKPNEPAQKSIYNHYQLPAITRHVYHH